VGTIYLLGMKTVLQSYTKWLYDTKLSDTCKFNLLQIDIFCSMCIIHVSLYSTTKLYTKNWRFYKKNKN